MAKEKSNGIIKELSYEDSTLIVCNEMTDNIIFHLPLECVFVEDYDEGILSKEEYIEFYTKLDDSDKNQIEAILHLIKNDVLVKGTIVEDKKGFYGKYVFETFFDKYQIKIYAPDWLLSIITPRVISGKWILPGFSLKELYEQALI